MKAMYQFYPIEVSHLDILVNLLYQRQQQELNAFDFLNHSRLTKENIKEKILSFFDNEIIIGQLAYHRDEPVGYMFAIIDDLKEKGKRACVPYEGMAVEKDDYLIQKIYQTVSDEWVKVGCFNHTFLVPLGNSIYYQTLLNLSFYIDHVFSVLNIAKITSINSNKTIHIRHATQDDKDELRNLSEIVTQHYHKSPTFLSLNKNLLESRKEAFAKLVDEDDNYLYLAQIDEKVVGYILYEKVDLSLMCPDFSLELTLLGVYEDYMNQGVGSSLFHHSIGLLSPTYYQYLITDYKRTNIEASYFWPKMGFYPVIYKMIRTIDPNYNPNPTKQ